MVAVWIGLGVCVAGIVGGLASAAVRGLRAWRALKATSRRLGAEVEAISTRAAEIETHIGRASASSERLAAASARLALSRARLAVLTGALREAQTTLARAVPFLGAR